MATVTISKIKFRRGTNAQRQFVILDQGEPAYTVDTKRLYIGTGNLSGGFVVGSKIHTTLLNLYSLSSLVAEVNDIVNVNNKFYQLTLPDYTNINSWTDVSAKIDTTFFNYDSTNTITLNTGSISASFLNPDTIDGGLKVDSGLLQLDFNTKSLELSSNQLSIKESGINEREISSTTLTGGLIGGSGLKIQLDFNTKSLELSSNQLSIKESGIDEREISSTTLSFGLTGGSGEKIRLNVNPDHFYFDNNTLNVSASPIEFSSLNSAWFGDGLDYDIGGEEITTILQNVDFDTIALNSGVISVNPLIFGSGLSYDTFTDSVSTTLTGIYDNNTLTRVVSSGQISLSSIAPEVSHEWPSVTVDTYGRATRVQSSIYEIFEGRSDLNATSLSSLGPLSSIFNGNPTGIIQGVGTPMITKFAALSSDFTTVIELSSAGFIVFQGNVTTRDSNSEIIPRFAIPIFRF